MYEIEFNGIKLLNAWFQYATKSVREKIEIYKEKVVNALFFPMEFFLYVWKCTTIVLSEDFLYILEKRKTKFDFLKLKNALFRLLTCFSILYRSVKHKSECHMNYSFLCVFFLCLVFILNHHWTLNRYKSSPFFYLIKKMRIKWQLIHTKWDVGFISACLWISSSEFI